MWFQCTECVFATNSPKVAAKHDLIDGHIVLEDRS